MSIMTAKNVDSTEVERVREIAKDSIFGWERVVSAILENGLVEIKTGEDLEKIMIRYMG